jgi:hypothetical protein
MKDLAAQFKRNLELAAKYKSDVTKLFTSSVKFQKEVHMGSILTPVVWQCTFDDTILAEATGWQHAIPHGKTATN